MKTLAKNIMADLLSSGLIDLDSLVEQINDYLPDFNSRKFIEAFEFAAVAHHGQMRKEKGIPYIVHPFETAKILAGLHADETTLIASLLHDVPEDTQFSLENIESKFGKKIAYLIEGITKLSKVHYNNNMLQRNVESLQKLFIHFAQDPRTILIKLADRLHNMRTLQYVEKIEKRQRIAKETLEIFAPIAGLLGIREVQTELEELCFINLYPEQYQILKNIVEQSRRVNSELLEQSIEEVQNSLKLNKINATVYSKYPTLYSIYKYLLREGKTLEQYSPRFRFYVIVEDIPTSYQTLGVIHSLYKPVPNGVHDYISLPKPSGYQGLHTAAYGVNGIRTKFLIRTKLMNFEAQYGIVASYFLNDQSVKIKQMLEQQDWMEELLNLQNSEVEQNEYLNKIKTDIFIDKINVVTPKGDIIELPEGATCLDFAYAIHTEVGNKAIRAIVNEQNSPLWHRLNNGDNVKIITTEYSKGPSYEWLKMVKTSLAKSRIKEYFKKESRSSKIIIGRRILQKEYDRAGLGLVSSLSKIKLQRVSEKFTSYSIKNLEDVLVHIAEGDISPLEFVNLAFQRAPGKKFNHKKPVNRVKLEIKIIAEPELDFTDLIKVINSRRDSVFLLKSTTSFNPVTRKLTVNSTMLVSSYGDISEIITQLENTDKVISVERLFWKRKIAFFMASIFTFVFWAIHPLIMNWLSQNWISQNPGEKFLPNLMLFSGLFILVGLIFFIKNFSEKSFPEMRESNKLWVIAYLLSFFAFLTTAMEIYFYKIDFDWFFVILSGVLLFAYLTGQYLFSREK